MKKILFIIIITAAAAIIVSAQRSGIPGKSQKAAAPVVTWHKVKLERWGLTSIELPMDLLERNDTTEPVKNGDVTWTDNAAGWEPMSKKPGTRFFEVNIAVTTWDVPYAKIAPDIRPELATPENFLELDLIGDMKNKQQKDSRVIDADYHKIGEVQGSLTVAKDIDNKARIELIWQTFRYYKTKPQRVTVHVIADRSERAAATKLIDSLILESSGK